MINLTVSLSPTKSFQHKQQLTELRDIIQTNIPWIEIPEQLCIISGQLSATNYHQCNAWPKTPAGDLEQ